MSKSHTAGWASDAPTPAQLAELFRQIDSGRVTKVTLQAFLRNGTPSREEAAHIVMGDDIIFPEDVMAACGITYSEEALKHLAETLPSMEQLKWCKENNYALVAGPPTEMSLLDVRSTKSSLFYSKAGGWYTNQPFAANEKVVCRWLAICKTEVLNSLNKNWDAQQKLLSKDKEVPNAAEMSWFITTYYEVRGVYLFKCVHVRTSSIASGDYCVSVGGFDGSGLGVRNDLYVNFGGDLGLSASREFLRTQAG